MRTAAPLINEIDRIGGPVDANERKRRTEIVQASFLLYQPHEVPNPPQTKLAGFGAREDIGTQARKCGNIAAMMSAETPR